MHSHQGRGGIFISYRREETAADAGRLYDHLSERFGEERVFMDIDSIALGVDFTKAIMDAVSKCDVLLVLIGPDWLNITDSKGKRRLNDSDDWVRVEIETAIRRDIRIVPVLIDDAPLPQITDLPSGLQPLTRRQALRLSYASFRFEVGRLISVVEEALENASGKSTDGSGASSPTVAQQGKWKLQLLAEEGYKMTFKLSSTKEDHVITTSLGQPFFEWIEVDGIRIAKSYINGKEYPLSVPGRSIGSNATIKVAYKSTFFHGMNYESVIIQIDGQVLAWAPRGK